MQPGYNHTALGALRYMSLWGSGGHRGGFVERLLALDDRHFTMCAGCPATSVPGFMCGLPVKHPALAGAGRARKEASQHLL